MVPVLFKVIQTLTATRAHAALTPTRLKSRHRRKVERPTHALLPGLRLPHLARRAAIGELVAHERKIKVGTLVFSGGYALFRGTHLDALSIRFFIEDVLSDAQHSPPRETGHPNIERYREHPSAME